MPRVARRRWRASWEERLNDARQEIYVHGLFMRKAKGKCWQPECRELSSYACLLVLTQLNGIDVRSPWTGTLFGMGSIEDPPAVIVDYVSLQSMINFWHRRAVTDS